MSALPLVNILTPVQARLSSQTGLSFGLAAPLSLDPTVDTVAYILHLYPEDVVRATGVVIRRTHHIEVRLWSRAPDDATEQAFLALCDVIHEAFRQDQRLGLTTIHAAGMHAVNAPPYIEINKGPVRRQRVWRLDVIEDFQVDMQ